MTRNHLRGLKCRWPSALLAALAISCATIVLHAQTPGDAAKLPAFEVASIRQNTSGADQFRLMFTPDGVQIRNASMLMIIRAAYGMFNSLDDKFIGAPAWTKSERFDIEAKVDGADVDAYKKLSFEQRQRMVQALLSERSELQTHQETREQPVYTLSVAKSGSKLQPSKPDAEAKNISLTRGNGKIVGHEAVLSQLASALTQALGRTVQDRTGLTGNYDFTLQWTPEEQAGDPAGAHDESGASVFTAVTEQLGLKLQSTRASVQCLVIDHVE